MLSKKHIQMLEFLGNNKIFKFTTNLKGDLKYLFKGYSDDDITDFILSIYNCNIFITHERFKKNKTKEDNCLTVVINWEKAINNKFISENNVISRIYKEKPINFKTTTEKTYFFSNLEYIGFKQPAHLLNTLDIFFMLYFTDYEKYKQILEQESNLDIDVLFANLQVYLKMLPVYKNELFTIDKYEEMLNELGIKIENKLKSKILETTEKELNLLEQEQKEEE